MQHLPTSSRNLLYGPFASPCSFLEANIHIPVFLAALGGVHRVPHVSFIRTSEFRRKCCEETAGISVTNRLAYLPCLLRPYFSFGRGAAPPMHTPRDKPSNAGTITWLQERKTFVRQTIYGTPRHSEIKLTVKLGL